MTRPKIFLLQHLACSGGTIFTRAVSTIPGTVVISEVHPDRNLQSKFDPVWQFLTAYKLLRVGDEKALHDQFLNSIEFISDVCRRESRQLVIRDHFHHDFERNVPSITNRVLSERFDVQRIYLARDPVDVWIALRERGWSGTLLLKDFLNKWLDTWKGFENTSACSRYSYEEFCENPSDAINEISLSMGRIWNETLLKYLYDRKNMTGNSGRDGGGIKRRRTQYELLAFEDVKLISSSNVYREICDSLGCKYFAKREIPKVWRSALNINV